jgi:hypothetical protein
MREKKPLRQRSPQGLELPDSSLVWDENKERQSVPVIVKIMPMPASRQCVSADNCC